MGPELEEDRGGRGGAGPDSGAVVFLGGAVSGGLRTTPKRAS